MRESGGATATMVHQRAKKEAPVQMKRDIMRDPMAVTWTEKYSETIEKYWAKIPSFLASCIATTAVFILGATMNG